VAFILLNRFSFVSVVGADKLTQHLGCLPSILTMVKKDEKDYGLATATSKLVTDDDDAALAQLGYKGQHQKYPRNNN